MPLSKSLKLRSFKKRRTNHCTRKLLPAELLITIGTLWVYSTYSHVCHSTVTSSISWLNFGLHVCWFIVVNNCGRVTAHSICDSAQYLRLNLQICKWLFYRRFACRERPSDYPSHSHCAVSAVPSFWQRHTLSVISISIQRKLDYSSTNGLTGLPLKYTMLV